MIDTAARLVVMTIVLVVAAVIVVANAVFWTGLLLHYLRERRRRD